MEHFMDDFTLLVDGAEAFPEILSCIRNAEKSIYINMFIWRDDYIGNTIARAILEAADRNVKVYLSVDRVGAVLELAEEYRSSFFHKHITWKEWVKVKGIRLLYPSLSTKVRVIDEDFSVYDAITKHSNITVDIDSFKADHSKYYIFDEEVLIMGGINIEDKENGTDISGRIYQDYMVKMRGISYVEHLKRALRGEQASSENFGFCVNTKECLPNCFAMRKHYLDIIRNAQKELIIIMAYFEPPKEFLESIIDACERNVQVTLLIPARSNFMNSASLQAARYLMKKTGNHMKLYLSPKMLHTKLIASETQISMGSTNMMKNSFCHLSELNLFFHRKQHPFCCRIMQSIADNIAASKRIEDGSTLRYSHILAWMESLFE